MTGLLQVVPRLPAAADGVGGMARALARALRDTGLPSEVLEAAIDDPAWRTREARHLLLHYVNYGFDADGCPAWLVEQVEAWQRAAPERRLWVYFHEVYATSPPWRRTFWFSRRQRALAARLGRLAALSFTSLELYRELLLDLGVRSTILVRGITSNVGEPDPPSAWDARAPRLVVFGSPGVRGRAYAEGRRALRRACSLLGVEAIADVGAGAVAPAACGGVPVTAHGRLGAAEVSAALSDARAGFLAYPLDFLGKSGIFAAYAAHGVLPACTGRAARREEAPRAGIHYWDAGRDRPPREPAAVAGAARAWYEAHDLGSLAALLRRQVEVG